MKRIAFSLLVFSTLFFTAIASAGPVIIGGDDLDLHGYRSGGVNHLGWLYIEKAINSMYQPGCITIPNDGSIAALGAPASTLQTGGYAGAAIYYGALGHSVQYFEGAPAIASFFAGLGTTYKPAIIYIPSPDYDAVNGLTAAEQTELVNGAVKIRNFVNAGGGLMAHVQGPPNPRVALWLPIVLGPGFSFSPAACMSFNAALTAQGTAAFPLLTNSDIAAGPCHTTFATYAGLNVLAVDYNRNAFIIGGGCGTVIGPAPDFTAPNVCAGVATQFTNTTTNASSSTTYSWNFGDGSAASTATSPSHLYANPGTYTVTLTLNTGQTVSHPVTVYPRPPTPVINGPAVTCGSPSTYCVAAIPGVTYNWTVTGGTASSLTGSCITVTWNATGSHSLLVVATNQYGCQSRFVLDVKPCEEVDCCNGINLDAQLSGFTAVGGGNYDLTSTLSGAPGWSITRMQADIVNTNILYSPTFCGTSGPANSYVTAVTPSTAPLTVVSIPFAFGREADWDSSTANSGVTLPAPFTFTAHFPTPPGGFLCADYLSFCIRYTVTMTRTFECQFQCRTCTFYRCYGPFKRSHIIIIDTPDTVEVGRTFPVRVSVTPGEKSAEESGNNAIILGIKPGTGDPLAQVTGEVRTTLNESGATFNDIAINRAGKGYVLVISAEDGTPIAETKPFDVRDRANPK